MFAGMLTISFDARDPARLAQFWAGLLGREVSGDAGGVRLPGTATQVGLRFAPGPASRPGLSRRLHLHLTSADLAEQEQTAATARRLGGTDLDVGQRPEEGHVVLADPEGNAFCVIEPGNAFLAGCGRLGEVACSGTRPVGLFWSAALGWPLVWDENQETAIQSPRGGTKVAWGGPPVPPKQVPNPQHFELSTDGDPRAHLDRLVALGATELEAGANGVVLLADPDGNEFRVRAAQGS